MQAIAPPDGLVRRGDPTVLERLFDDTTCDVLWSGPAGGGSLWVSGSATRICGFSPAEILATAGNIWLGRAHPADAARIEDAYRLLVVTGARFQVVYRWQRQDGE